MADGIYSDRFVYRVDDDGEREVTGFPVGPAGVASMDLGEGVTVVVDFAEPATMSSVRFEPGASAELAAALLGDQVAQRVMSASPSDRPRSVGERSDQARRQLNSDPRWRDPDQAAVDLGLSTVLSSLADDAERHELARGTAALELWTSAERLALPRATVDGVRARALARTAALMAAGVDGIGHLIELDMGSAELLDKQLSWAASRGEPRSTELRRVSKQLGDALAAAGRWHQIAASALPEAQAMPAAAAAPPQPLFLDLRPNGRLVVHRPYSADESDAWVRVVRNGSMVLLAMSPFHPSGGHLRADLLVPPDLELDDLAVEVTHAPLPVRNSLEAARRAVRFGRQAVSLEALNHPRAASEWSKCASAWAELGDDRRATLATQRIHEPSYARSASLGERVQQAFDAA